MSKQTSQSHRWISLRRGLWLAVVLAATSTCAWGAQSATDFELHRQKTIAKIQQQYRQIAKDHQGQPGMQEFQERIDLIDEVAELLVGRFESVNTASLDELLDDMDEGSVETDGAVAAVWIEGMTAAEILSEYSELFAEALPTPALGKEQLEILRKYYEAKMRAAGGFIAERGAVAAAVSAKGAGSIAELCLVMGFLQIPDSAWSQKHIDSLADWMRKPANIKRIESFSLESQRPFTAWRFALSLRSSRNSGAKDKPDPIRYFSQTAEGLFADGDYAAGLECLKAAITLTRRDGDRDAEAKIRFDLAVKFKEIGHPNLAADEMMRVISSPAGDSHIAKAMTLRLTYLYASGQFEDVIAEATKYKADPRCSGYLPRIHYVLWVVYRRTGELEHSDALSKKFIEQFPAHPLAADMYFSSAMDAIQAGEYGEALRLLEIVQQRFPQSRILDKVRRIRGKLENRGA